MLFTETAYLFLFLPVVAVLFYRLTPRFGAHAGMVVLLLASVIFYLPWGARDTALLVASTTLNFAAIRLLLTLGDARARLRRVILAAGQTYNFASLFWFKYGIVMTLFGMDADQHFSLINMIIPIGISFYTFQQAMFLLEAYHRTPAVLSYLDAVSGSAATGRAYLRYAFFVLFFPHLVIGPIVYVEELQPQVDDPNWGRVKRSNIEAGLVFLAVGLFKKAVLADNLAPTVDAIFAASIRGENIAAPVAWFGAIGYCVQLYFDFSGYADMAMGGARLFGIRYPANFYSPFKATSIAEYYRRWHITLTRVISRFVFLPLSLAGTRFAARQGWRGIAARSASAWLPLLINFELIALWHGAHATFVLFGIIHGIWYILDTEFRRLPFFRAWITRSSRGVLAPIAHAAFLLPLVITFALFRSSGLGNFFHYAQRMFSLHGRGSVVIHLNHVLLLALCLAIIWFLPNSIEFLRRYRPALPVYQNAFRVWPSLRFAWGSNWVWSAFVAALFLIGLYYLGQEPPFLYMGF